MRFQRVSGIWRYVGLCAIIIYFVSFGSFMSRMMSANRDAVSVELATDLHSSTREVAQTLSMTTRNPLGDIPKSTVNPFLDVPKSTIRPASQDVPKSTVRSEIPERMTPLPLEKSSLPGLHAPYSILEKLDQDLKPEVSRRTSGSSEPEADDQPEVKLLRLFELQRNASAVVKPNRVDGALRHLSAANLTKGPTGNASAGPVINPHPFRYLINCEALCQKSPDLFLLVYVHTAPDHYKRRIIIRQTWGGAEQYSVDIRVVFFTGRPDSTGVQRALQFEAEQYGDIVQEDFLDTYRNLTYKGIAALKWISNYCPIARFVLKTDDDIFVNMFTLIRHLKRIRPNRGQNDVHGLLMCLVWHGMPVMRSGKWMVSKDEWKEDTYATYCSGSAFVLSTDVAIALHNVSYHVPFFWVDDFYITGLLPLKLGNISHTQFMSTYLLNGRDLEEKFTGAQWYKYVFSHVHNLDAIQSVWRKVVALSKGDLVPTIQYLVPKNTTVAPRSH